MTVKKYIYRLIAAAFAVAFLGAGQAQAVLISETESFFMRKTALARGPVVTDSRTLTFNKYGGTGSLTGVSIAVEGYGDGVVFQEVSNGGGTFSPTGRADYMVSSPLTNSLSRNVSKTASVICVPNCTSPTSDRQGYFRWVVGTLTPTDLSDFIGPGTFDITALMNLVVTGGANSGSFTTGYMDGRWRGDVTVTYDVEPAAEPVVTVPEPGALGLFAMGLLGLGAACRRRRG